MTTQSSVLLSTLDAYQPDAPIQVVGTLAVYKTRRSADRRVVTDASWAAGAACTLAVEPLADGQYRVTMTGEHPAEAVARMVRLGMVDASDVILDASAPIPAGTVVRVSGVRRGLRGDVVPYGGVYRTVRHHGPTGRLVVDAYDGWKIVREDETVRIDVQPVPMPSEAPPARVADPACPKCVAYERPCGRHEPTDVVSDVVLPGDPVHLPCDACGAMPGEPCHVGCLGAAAVDDVEVVDDRSEKVRCQAGAAILARLLDTVDLSTVLGMDAEDADAALADARDALDSLDTFLVACD